jgi:hypothetical protein
MPKPEERETTEEEIRPPEAENPKFEQEGMEGTESFEEPALVSARRVLLRNFRRDRVASWDLRAANPPTVVSEKLGAFRALVVSYPQEFGFCERMRGSLRTSPLALQIVKDRAWLRIRNTGHQASYKAIWTGRSDEWTSLGFGRR